jgi:hypothetical protein
LLGAVTCWVYWLRQSPPWNDEPGAPGSAASEAAPKLSALEDRERHVEETVWAKELLAQKCGRAFEILWDALNAATTTNKLALLATFPAGEVLLGRWDRPERLPHGIERRASSGAGPVFAGDAWRRYVTGFGREGWQLDQTEFRHNRFETDEAGRPARSLFYFSAHLTNPRTQHRASLAGDLAVTWHAATTNNLPPTIARTDASGLTLTSRMGEPFLLPILHQELLADDQAYFIDPLILHDLDGDGLAELILGVKNLVYRRHGQDAYVRESLCRYSPGLIFTGAIADFDGDGLADFLCARADGLLLFQGSPQGTFDQPSVPAWAASEPLKNVMALTCGDIDRDGDLDVFLGQYRVPRLSQVLRPHYYEANDGHPSYLLLNDGHGHFTNATAAAGLSQNRWRRTFGASFVDLDDDGHLDLLVVSDFAGLALYRNDGAGHFRDLTSGWVAESHAFGMSHTAADFNADGRLDLLMIGMNSPTVDRLEHLGLRRAGTADDPVMRRRMTYGNRLYLGRSEPGFAPSPLNEPIARTGWSWGCCAPDLDNDGFPDLYIANGHESKQSVRDYEPEFWLHDLYVDCPTNELMVSAYFLDRYQRTRGQGWSYSGYEKNRLYLNRGGTSFVEVAHLAGVALQADSRNAVADDLDGDGRVDLLVTTFEVWPQARQTLRAFRNALAETGHWIGFRFPQQPGHRSPIGTRVTLHYAGHTAVQQLVTGEGFRSQRANTLHFGLGEADRVRRAEIRWPDGEVTVLPQPTPDRYHVLVR